MTIIFLIGDYHLPIGDYHLPIGDYYLPISNYHLPIGDYYLPISNYNTNHMLLISVDNFHYIVDKIIKIVDKTKVTVYID